MRIHSAEASSSSCPSLGRMAAAPLADADSTRCATGSGSPPASERCTASRLTACSSGMERYTGH